MLVSSFNLSQSFNFTPYLFYKKLFKSEVNSFCIWILDPFVLTYFWRFRPDPWHWEPDRTIKHYLRLYARARIGWQTASTCKDATWIPVNI